MFASIAFAIIARDRGEIEGLRGEYARARLEAAVEAGLARAIEGLAIDDPTQRWTIDGRLKVVDFEGVRLSITIEDERGKAPMDNLTEEQVRRLFTAAGASGDRLEVLVDAYQDWLDDDDAPRSHGAEAPQYAAQGLRPRNGVPVTVEELIHLRGMDRVILARIKPALAPNFGISGPFNAATASPIALQVMVAGAEDSPEVLERQKELSGERPAFGIIQEPSLAGRALTVVVRARNRDGGTLERRTVVELTGRNDPAFYVRQLD